MRGVPPPPPPPPSAPLSRKRLLFDDHRARTWEPFALTRPIGELRFGALLLRERAERTWGATCAGTVDRPELDGFQEEGAPPVVGPEALDPSAARVLVSSRAVLDPSSLPPLDRAATLMVGDQVAGWVLPAGQPAPGGDALRRPTGPTPDLPRVEVLGGLLDEPWTLVARNGDRVRRDAPLLDLPALSPPADVHVVGAGGLFGAADVVVEPGVVVDTTAGPVLLEGGVRVQGPARLEGPVYLGAGTVVFGGHLSNCAVGPRCKVRGEVADSVLTGFCNKAHDGYLGHALLGRWVNLGALTTNSDLKNNYGPVRVERSTGLVDTGLMKVGVFLGDHVRTGIGTLLTTGAVVGAGSNLFGGAMPPRRVPPFSWGSGAHLTETRLDRFLETASAVMARRHQELTPSMAGLWTRAFEATRPQRTTGDAPL